MFDEVTKEILKLINQDSFSDEIYPKFSGDGYAAHKIDLGNFREIEARGAKKVAFVDGGNAEIIGSANFSLSIIRACYSIFQYKKKLSIMRHQALSLAKALNHHNEIFFKASFFDSSLGLQESLFSSLDRSLMVGASRAEISSVAKASMRFAELKLAKLIAEQRIADIIVLDGTLQSTFPYENEYLDQLYGSCEKNGIQLSALSKTTSIFTENGNSLSAVLEGISPFNSWFYYPVVSISTPSHRAEIFFVKLHEGSKHVFRLEIFNRQKDDAVGMISELAHNSTDLLFLGYPYGMIEADRIARISNSERDALTSRFQFMLQGKNIEKYLSSKNAHGILDRASF